MSTWSELTVAEKGALIAQHWPPNASASSIAAAVGTTRNAVLGIYTRNPALSIKFPLGNRPQNVEREIIEALNTTEYDATAFRCSLVENTGCKWPVAEDERGHLFCGHKREFGSSYCRHHRQRNIRSC